MDNMSFWCLFCYLETYFTPFSNVFIVDFEHVFVCWELISFIEQENVCYSYFQYSTKASAIISFAKILEIAVTSFLKKKMKKKIKSIKKKKKKKKKKSNYFLKCSQFNAFQ